MKHLSILKSMLCLTLIQLLVASSAFASYPYVMDSSGHTEPWTKQGFMQSNTTGGHQNNNEAVLPFNWKMRSELAAHNAAYANLLTYGLPTSEELKCLETYNDGIWTVVFVFPYITYEFTFYAQTGTLINLVQK